MACMKLALVGFGPAALRPATKALMVRYDSCSAKVGGPVTPTAARSAARCLVAGVFASAGAPMVSKSTPCAACTPAGEARMSPPYPVGSRTAFSLTPSWCRAPTSANEVLGTTGRKSPSTPAAFMASAIGPTLVLPNGNWLLRYPDFSPTIPQDLMNPLAAPCELGELE